MLSSLKNRLKGMFCKDELILQWGTEFSVVFYLLTTLHRFDSAIVTHWTLNKWRQVEGDMYIYRHFLTCFPHKSRSGKKGTLSQTVKVKALLVSRMFKCVDVTNASCAINAVRGYEQELDCDSRIKLIAIKKVRDLWNHYRSWVLRKKFSKS